MSNNDADVLELVSVVQVQHKGCFGKSSQTCKLLHTTESCYRTINGVNFPKRTFLDENQVAPRFQNNCNSRPEAEFRGLLKFSFIHKKGAHK